MIEMPLFPLNTVLFPGMPMELHIFEDRYKLMIGMCVEKRMPFGIVLLEQGRAELDPTSPEPKPFMIGCTAQITQVKPLPEGRMNITIVGRERFQILSLHHDKPYLVGMVEMTPLEIGDSRQLLKSSRNLRQWIERYLRVLEKAGQIQFDPRQLPPDTASLAYLGAVLLQGVSLFQKQELLAAETLTGMVDALRGIYRREVVLLETLLTPPEGDNPTPFSLN
jgi:Lon protease-like protein